MARPQSRRDDGIAEVATAIIRRAIPAITHRPVAAG